MEYDAVIENVSKTFLMKQTSCIWDFLKSKHKIELQVI